MNRKIIYGLLFLTAIALFMAPQAATLDLMMPAPVFVLFLILGSWLTLVVKKLYNPG